MSNYDCGVDREEKAAHLLHVAGTMLTETYTDSPEALLKMVDAVLLQQVAHTHLLYTILEKLELPEEG